MLAAGAAFATVPVAAATPGYCRGQILNAHALPERIALAGCDIVGATVVAGGLRVVVPPRGHGSVVHALKTNGEASLSVRTSPDGIVTVSVEESGGFTAAAAASNDMFAAATVVETPTAFDWSRNGTTVDATVEAKDAIADEACGMHADKRPDRSVWYRYKAKHYGTVKVLLSNVSPAGTTIRTDVFQDRLDNPIACGRASAYLNTGSVYLIRVGTRAAPAAFKLRWFPPAPAADQFGKAPSKTLPSQTFTSKMFGATLQAGEPAPACKTTWTGTVWQQVLPGTLRRITVNAGGRPLAVYRGSSLGGLTQLACFNTAHGQLVTLTSSGPYYIQQWVKPTDEAAQLWVDSGEALPEALAPCSDTARALMDVAPRKPFRWRFNDNNVPASLGTSAASAIRQGIEVITGAKNDCGMPDRVSASHEYLSRTALPASRCANSTSDGHNVIDFGPASDYGVLGLACSAQTSPDGINWSISETDIRMTKNEAWTLNPDAPSCGWAYDFVGVVAHEAGHTFGLLHPYAQGNLTMAAYSTGCTGAYRTLGKSDVMGLEARY